VKQRISSVWLRRVLPFGLLAALAIALWGAYETHANVSATFDRQTQIQQAQVTLEEMLRFQIDEENSLRGFIATKDPFYKDQYVTAVGEVAVREGRMRSALLAQGLTDVQGQMDDYVASQNDWRTHVADPTIANPNRHTDDVDKRGKFYTDQEGIISKSVRDALAGQNNRLATDTLGSINLSSWVSVIGFALFAVISFWIASANAAARRELGRDKTTIETLQNVYLSRTIPLPHCEIGSAYAAASSAFAVGGDVYDMYRLSERNALIMIADVSGKGVDAAVLTAFIKFTIRSIALRRPEPGRILAEFNTAFAHAYTVDNPSLFVSMFVGVLDPEASYMQYASAGHDSAFIRRSNGVQQLAVTGPVLGVMEEPFETRTVQLADGDTIVLATDGLTEARHRNGELLHEQGAMELIERSDPDPQRMADELVAQVRALGDNHMRDDLAILAIRVLGGERA
jgi:sigma-B regulation protein RsbU (phosphoserine phosphatase)